MAIEYNGDDFLYLLRVPGVGGGVVHRIFNQTDGSHTLESETIDLKTKDKTGAGHGSNTEEVSIEGILTRDDPAVAYLRRAMRTKKYVEIIRVDEVTLATEVGIYKVNNLETSSSTGEFATYSIDATLNGEVEEGVLDILPEGAPEEEIDMGGEL